MDESAKKPQESNRTDAFSNDDEIKVLERRLQLLREGLKPAGREVSAAEDKQEKEFTETESGEGPGSSPPTPPQPPMAAPAYDRHFHETKVSELKTYESDRQVKALVEIAFERGVFDAVEIARRLDDAYLLDAFHDLLEDDEKLHKELIEQGKLKEIR